MITTDRKTATKKGNGKKASTTKPTDFSGRTYLCLENIVIRFFLSTDNCGGGDALQILCYNFLTIQLCHIHSNSSLLSLFRCYHLISYMDAFLSLHFDISFLKSYLCLDHCQKWHRYIDTRKKLKKKQDKISEKNSLYIHQSMQKYLRYASLKKAKY